MKNLKIGTRLVIGFASILILLTVIVGIGIGRLSKLNDNVVAMSDKHTPSILTANRWIAAMQQSARQTHFMVTLYDQEKIKMEVDGVTKLKNQRKQYIDGLQKTVLSDEGKAMLRKVIDAHNTYAPSESEFLRLVLAEDIVNAKKILLDKMDPALLTYSTALDGLMDFQANVVKEASLSAQQDYQSGRTFMIALLAGALLIGMAYALIVTRSITRPMREAVLIAQTVAAGNLSSRIVVSSKDETGQLLQALKDMNEELVNIVSEVRGGTETIAEASQRIAAGNADLSARTEGQASSLEETASSMEEMTSTVKQNADNARQANQLAVAASAVAVKGGAAVSEVIGTMGQINESARKIVDIIGVINGLAFQTNILALNAAVEAARAGEQGRGFAVVASEVRNLAQRSAAAAKEIKALIDNSMEKVDMGSRLVDRAGTTMQEVVASIKRVTDIMADISNASQEQTVGINQINQAILQMDNVTQQNAALVDLSATASQEMQRQAEKLAQAVGVFTLDEHASAAAAKQPLPSPRAEARYLGHTAAIH